MNYILVQTKAEAYRIFNFQRKFRENTLSPRAVSVRERQVGVFNSCKGPELKEVVQIIFTKIHLFLWQVTKHNNELSEYVGRCNT